MWETWVQSLGWEDPLKEGKVTHSSVLAWRIPMDRGPGALQSLGGGGLKELDTTERHITALSGEGWVWDIIDADFKCVLLAPEC